MFLINYHSSLPFELKHKISSNRLKKTSSVDYLRTTSNSIWRKSTENDSQVRSRDVGSMELLNSSRDRLFNKTIELRTNVGDANFMHGLETEKYTMLDDVKEEGNSGWETKKRHQTQVLSKSYLENQGISSRNSIDTK